MHYHLRKSIFFLFLLTFIVGAPLVVLYTAGYRFNFGTWHVQQTGVIAISTYPRSANVFLDGSAVQAKTPYVIQRLSPGSYTLTLQKDGYKPWEERVDVTSGETTYVTTTLFADTTPNLLWESDAVAVVGEKNGRYITVLKNNEDKTQSLVRFDTVTETSRTLTTLNDAYADMITNPQESLIQLDNATSHIALNASTGGQVTEDVLAHEWTPLPEYSFVDNGVNTEFRNTSTNTLITLLPPGTYTIPFATADLVLMSDSRGRTYLFSLKTQTINQIALPTDVVAMNDGENLFVGSDGNEIDIYNPRDNTTTLLARQSEPVLALGWYNNGQTVLCATDKNIFALAREQYETREVTPLIEQADIKGMWLDTTSTRVIFFGTISGKTGLWDLSLTQ